MGAGLGGVETVSDLSEVVEKLREQGTAATTKKICFVTDELPGLFRNGGAGTATLGLARRLIDEGHDVTALYASGVDLQSPAIRSGIDGLTSGGLKLFFLSEENDTPSWSATNRHRSYAVYSWLKKQEFDIVLFHDFSGLGFYSCQAKRGAAFFHDTVLAVVCHGSSSWGWELMEEILRSPEMLEQQFIEQTAVENADVVLSPSQFLVQWMKKRGYKLPRHTYVQRNIMPDLSGGSGPLNPSVHYPVNEIVFFGRHELRKGFHIFVEAMSRVGGDFSIPKITFLGKWGMIHGEQSGAYAVERLQRAPAELNFYAEFDRDEAIRYLKRPGVLAVMPSMEENLPSVVYECVMEGINFVSSDRGGTSELLDEQSRRERLYYFPDNAHPGAIADALLKKIREVVETPGAPSRLSFDPAASAQTYADWHALVTPAQHNVPAENRLPLVSVVIVHHDRPRFLRQVLQSIEDQTYSNLEIIVVDDGSKTAEAKASIEKLRQKDGPRPLKVIETPDLFLGGARNAGTRRALGEYLIFVDDDNVAMPTMVEALVRAAQATNADVVTCLAHVLRGKSGPTGTELVEYLPLGGAAAVGCFNNCFGDANALFRRQTFDALGGFLGNRVGAEDWELMARATLKGYLVFVLPEAQYYYRIHQDSLTSKPHSIRDYNRQIALLYCKIPHPCLSGIIQVTQGQLIEPRIKGATWELLGRRPKGEFQRQLLGVGDAEEVKRLVAVLLGEYQRYGDAIRMAMQLKSYEASLGNVRHLVASAALTGAMPAPLQAPGDGNGPPVSADGSSYIFQVSAAHLQSAVPEGMSPAEKKTLVTFDGSCNELQVHPKPRTVVWARLPKMLPQGTIRVVAQARTKNDKAAIVEYGLAIEGKTGFVDRLVRRTAPILSFWKKNGTFSGWTKLDPLRQGMIELKFDKPLDEPHDLLLATRPHNGKGTTSYAWARFFDIWYETVQEKG